MIVILTIFGGDLIQYYIPGINVLATYVALLLVRVTIAFAPQPFP